MARQRKSLWTGVALTFVTLAAVGLGVSSWMFSRWSRLETATPEQAARAFAEALAAAGGGIPYIAIAADGSVRVHRELERDVPADLTTLHLLAWEPARQRLVVVDFPFWFVRMKMTRKLNLGTLTSALARDWEHIDLSVTEEDLQRRGPGLVLDHTAAGGARIVMWTQ